MRSAIAIVVARVQSGFAALKAAASSAATPLAPLMEFVQRFSTAVATDIAMIAAFAKRVGTFLAGLGKAVMGVLERFPWLGTVLGHVGVIVGVATVAIVALAGAIVFLTAPLVPLAAIVVKAAVALRTIWMALKAVGGVTAIVGRGLWTVGGAARGAGGRIVSAIRGIPSLLMNLRSRFMAALPMFQRFGSGIVRMLAGGRWKAAAALAGTAILVGLVTGWRRIVEVVPAYAAKLKTQILAVAPWMGPVIGAITNVAKVIGGAYLLIGTFALGAGLGCAVRSTGLGSSAGFARVFDAVGATDLGVCANRVWPRGCDRAIDVCRVAKNGQFFDGNRGYGDRIGDRMD